MHTFQREKGSHLCELMAGITVTVVLLFLTIKMGSPYVPAAVICAIAVFLFLCLDPRRLVIAQIVLCSVLGYLTVSLGFPSLLNYATDLLTAGSVLFALLKIRREGLLVQFGAVPVLLLGLFLVGSASAVLNGVSPILYAWSLRTFFRVFAIMFAGAVLLKKSDIAIVCNIMFGVLAANVLLCSYQYFFEHLRSDYVSGLFGRNAALNVHLVIVSILALFRIKNGQKRLLLAVCTLVACCYIAAIAELKLYFVELIVVLALSLLAQKPSFKNLAIVAILLSLMAYFVTMLGEMYPTFADFFSLESMLEYAESNYGGGETVSRLNAIGMLDASFMPNALCESIGLGLGSGQHTQFFSSPLYSMYGEIYNWSWFSHASIFLETGYVGLFLYAAVFVGLCLLFWMKKNETPEMEWLMRCGAVFCIMCLILFFYNSTFIVEPACYLVGVFLALPLCALRTEASNGRKGGR